MKLKQRVGDFRVRELLDESYLKESGDFRVYRVSKRKLTTPEAIDALAAETGVDRADVGVAGWKDRQGITVQYMSVPRGRKVRIQDAELKVEAVGFGREPYSSEHSRGNGFELCVRALDGRDLSRLRRNLPLVREHGLVDYFDDQRFGNLTHGQGWIARELMLGRVEEALRALLTAPGAHDDDRRRRFKSELHRAWGDWRACRDIAGKFGAHHSVFEHLKSSPEDFAGAFRFIASRIRLIHLFAWQSHLWNRAAVDFVRSCTDVDQRVVMDSEEGVLVSFGEAPPAELATRSTLRLPGEGLDDLTDPVVLRLFEDVLAREGLVADQLRIDGLDGWKLKGEDRPLIVRPRHLRVRPAEEDGLNRGKRMIRVRFELPRGSYASLVIKRLFAGSVAEREAEGERARARAETKQDRDRDPQRSAWGATPPRPANARGQGHRDGETQGAGERRTPWGATPASAADRRGRGGPERRGRREFGEGRPHRRAGQWGGGDRASRGSRTARPQRDGSVWGRLREGESS